VADSNSQFRQGVHLSWAAIVAMIAATTLLIGLADRVRSQDMRLIEARIAALQNEGLRWQEDRLRMQVTVQAALVEQNRILDLRLARIETRLENVRQ